MREIRELHGFYFLGSILVVAKQYKCRHGPSPPLEGSTILWLVVGKRALYGVTAHPVHFLPAKLYMYVQLKRLYT